MNNNTHTKLSNDVMSSLRQLSSSKIVRFREGVQGLTVLKYDRKVFFNNLWDKYPLTKMCRGLILRGDYIQSLPFMKVFNYGENGAGDFVRDNPETLVEVSYKANGFMLAVSLLDGELLFNTTGSLDSDWVDMGVQMLSNHNKDELLHYLTNFPDRTVSLEIVSPDDNVHPTQEECGVWFLTTRQNIFDMNYFADSPMIASETYEKYFTSFLEVGFRIMKFSDVLKFVRRTETEGLMVHVPYIETFKMKSPFYLMTKFFMRLNDRKLMVLYNDVDQFKLNMRDEEFFWIADLLFKNPKFIYMAEKSKRDFIIDNYDEYLKRQCDVV